jgi:hypothetical protein
LSPAAAGDNGDAIDLTYWTERLQFIWSTATTFPTNTNTTSPSTST